MGGMTMRTSLTLALALLATSCTEKAVTDAGPQGWGPAQQSSWYGATQGSRLLPWAWAEVLERPGEPGRFFDAPWLTKFRLLPRGPGALPVGMAIDKQDDRAFTNTQLRWVAGQPNDAAWVGFNCSACHTAEINYQGKALRIDGGPALTDFQSLVEAVDAAMIETRADPAKWDRFAKAVLKASDSAPARTTLAGAVDQWLAWAKGIDRANKAELRPGFARVDAFGHIYNKVALLANRGPDFDPPPPNASDAPVSYPFLWNTSQADRVQWNGIAENTKVTVAGRPFEYGALGRNAGEVIGVYGDVRIGGPASLKGYPSSIRVESLNDLERNLALLKPPVWPAALMGTPDAAKVAAGRALFDKQCGGACHGSLAPGDIKTQFKTTVFPLKVAGTDPWMACNAFTYEAPSGAMAGLPSGYIKLPGKPEPERIGETAPIATLLRTAVVASLLEDKGALVRAAGATWLGVPPRPLVQVPAVRPTPAEVKAARLKRCETEVNALLGYRSRPLTGIWATAPFLHNGSVPTLYDLLLPPAARPAAFNVGSREYDPVKVGYVTAPSPTNSFRFVARDGGGLVPGNGNQGHDYNNTRLSDADRWALVEYLKTL